MNMTTKIAFGGYLLIALITVGIGIYYLSASQIMPYHLTAMGVAWEDLSSGAQIMTLNFMKSAGVGFLTTGIALGFLLIFPFRKGETWSRWALLSVSLSQLLFMTTRVFQVRTQTPAEPPLTLFIVLIVVAMASFILSFSEKSDWQETRPRK